jgi:hypothetical protein
MKWSDKELTKHFGHLEDHQFKGYNRALGVKIEGKEHFKQLLEKGNYIHADQANEMARKNAERQKFTGISEETKRKIARINQRANKKGEINWDDGLVRQMKDAGVDYSGYKKLPKHFQVNTEGGLR